MHIGSIKRYQRELRECKLDLYQLIILDLSCYRKCMSFLPQQFAVNVNYIRRLWERKSVFTNDCDRYNRSSGPMKERFRGYRQSQKMLMKFVC